MREQILYFLGWTIALPLAPLLYWQARRTRAHVRRLLPADGTHGRVDGPRALRLLTIGESTVASVGMPDHETGFTGWIARHLARRSGRGVSWTVLGRSGYTAARVRDELIGSIPSEPFDLIVIGLGGNDTFKLNSPLRFKRDLVALIHAIRSRQPTSPIVVASLPPVGSFPAFPPLLRRFLGELVELHRSVLHDLPDRLSNVRYSSRQLRPEEWIENSDRQVSIDDLFCDGVHPSSLTYRYWCEEIVDTAGI